MGRVSCPVKISRARILTTKPARDTNGTHMAKRRLLKHKKIGIRVTTAELAEFERWARDAGMTMADFGRSLFAAERAKRAAQVESVPQ